MKITEAEKMKGKDPCWKGYKMLGTKNKNGKEVPNCIPVKEGKLSYFQFKNYLVDSLSGCAGCDDDTVYGTVEEDFEPTGEEQYEDWMLDEAKDADKYSYIDQSGGQVIKGKSGTYVGYTHSATKGKGANILKHNNTKKYYAAGGSSTAFTQKTTLHDTPEDAARAYHKGNLAESGMKDVSYVVKEDAEQIDELKRTTLANYVSKAAGSYGRDKQNIGRESPDGTVAKARPELKRAVKNRLTGINRAAERLAKEETEIDEASKKPNATTRHLRDYPVSDKDVAKPVKKPEKKKPEQGVAEVSFDNASPMTKDSVKQDRIRSLKNLIAIAKEKGRQLRVQELELELKKLQGVAEKIELQEAEKNGKKVQLNKPFRTSDGKGKFAVYTKNDKGNVVKVNFGDTTGLTIKTSNPDRRRSFRARHNCDDPGPKHKARYWSCKAWSRDSVSAGLGT